MISRHMLESKLLGVLVCSLMLSAGAAASEAIADGSNATGTERTCGTVARTVAETYSQCKRGDIVGIRTLESRDVMAVCDFSKTIYYVRGEAAACVFAGVLRPPASRTDGGK